jgi:hypothetical protein
MRLAAASTSIRMSGQNRMAKKNFIHVTSVDNCAEAVNNSVLPVCNRYANLTRCEDLASNSRLCLGRRWRAQQCRSSMAAACGNAGRT